MVNIAKSNKPVDGDKNAKRPPFFQPKLTVNQPNDVYEQEADHMADKVMLMPDLSVNQNVFFKPVPNIIQRKCQACEEEDKLVHRKEVNGAAVQSKSELSGYINSLSSSGQQMSQSSRQFFEPRFGRDFSDVKIHTDTVAAKSAQSINALAYTSGNNIVFNSGQYSTDSDKGKKLMAHELTHVVQQKASDTTKFSSSTRRMIQRDESGSEGNNDANESGGGDASLLESELVCGYYNAKVWLSREEKDEQIFERLLHHFDGQPDAYRHLFWYRWGKGDPYKEDVTRLFDENPSVKKRIAKQIAPDLNAGIKHGILDGTTSSTAPIRQQDYDVDNWTNANGGIDQVTWELIGTFTPHNTNTFKIGINDPYQWHPNEERPTQCLHQAMERLKSQGAKEYTTTGTGDAIVLSIP